MSLGQLVQQLRQIAQEGSAALDMSAAEAGEGPRLRVKAESADHQPVVASAPPPPPPQAPVPASTRSESSHPPRRASNGTFWLIAAVLVVAAGAVAAYFFMTRKRRAGAEEPALPPVPAALQKRIEAYAQRVVERQQEAGEEDDEQAAPEQEPEVQRHVRFDEHVTEYPIPARRVSRRATANQMEDMKESDPQPPPAEREIPTLQISEAHRFEG